MRLIDLNPRWTKAFLHGPITGISFECPCCSSAERRQRLAVCFTPTIPACVLDQLGVEWPNKHVNDGVCHQRTGDTFDTITLSPSINCGACGHWHGHIQNGEVK